MRLPETTEEIKQRLGLVNGRVTGLKDVREAQEQLAEWAYEAARERWPDALRMLRGWASDAASEARFQAVWSHALERWPGVEDVLEKLILSERAILSAMGPIA